MIYISADFFHFKQYILYCLNYTWWSHTWYKQNLIFLKILCKADILSHLIHDILGQWIFFYHILKQLGLTILE